jgi:hypothetical protein
MACGIPDCSRRAGGTLQRFECPREPGVNRRPRVYPKRPCEAAKECHWVVELRSRVNDRRRCRYSGAAAQELKKSAPQGCLRLDVDEENLQTDRDRVCGERSDEYAAGREASAPNANGYIFRDTEGQLHGHMSMWRVLVARPKVGRPKISERQAPVPHPEHRYPKPTLGANPGGLLGTSSLV